MIGGHDGLDEPPDLLIIVVTSVRQLLELSHEILHVEGNGFSNVDKFICSALDALFRHQLLFEQLLAGTKTGIQDLNVHVGLIATELDQVTRQRVNLHGLAHVKNKDFSALRIGTCL